MSLRDRLVEIGTMSLLLGGFGFVAYSPPDKAIELKDGTKARVNYFDNRIEAEPLGHIFPMRLVDYNSDGILDEVKVVAHRKGAVTMLTSKPREVERELYKNIIEKAGLKK